MNEKIDEDQKQSEERVRAMFARRLIQVGLTSLTLSMLLLASASLTEKSWIISILLMLARTFGIASFLSGAGLLLLERWTLGTLLLISSIVLPVVSLIYFKTI